MAGRLGDLVGRKKVFLSGIVLFTASSIACGVAQSQAMLIVGRFFQGIGGALLGVGHHRHHRHRVPRARERARAMSAYIFVAVGGGSIGLLVGGILTQALNWHWIFFINVPIGVVHLRLRPGPDRGERGLGIRDGVDVAGSVLVTVSLMVGIYAISTATEYGWLSPTPSGSAGRPWSCWSASSSLESRLANPIMPLRILRIRTLTRSSIIRGCWPPGMFSTFFLGALYLEGVLGYCPVQTGLAFLPMSVTMGDPLGRDHAPGW